MSISSSLNASVMGLNVNGARLATISDNIANSATTGYKRSDVDFASLVTQRGETPYSAGGVTANTYKNIAEVGSLLSTGNATDIAVNGRGLLPVTSFEGLTQAATDRPLMLTPTGSFTADETGNLRTQSGLFLMGWPTDVNGNVNGVSRVSGADLEPVNVAALQFTAVPTSRVELGVNLPADSSVAGADGGNLNLPIEYFDPLGRAQTLTLQFTPTVPTTGASNQWQLDIFDGAGDPDTSIGQANAQFSAATANGGSIETITANGGATYNAEAGTLTVDVAHGPIEIFVGRPSGTAGLTQLSAPFTPTAISQNGEPIGDLQSIEIDDSGFLEAVYDTGFRRKLFQIPVGDVPNLNGLEALDGQALAISNDSGGLYLWNAGQGPTGSVTGFALMESTTDIASELTDLIETQRAYSSNAKIVQTVDEMLQETTNLKR
ncbi:MAG: flagellar hook-basal body complex protein [Pseudomonadota bacterium]